MSRRPSLTHRVRPAILVFVLALTCAPLSAQEEVVQLTGVVVDASGAAVVGATVVAASARGDREVRAITDGLGRYRLALPGPGRYRLSVARSGFGDSSREIDVSGEQSLDWSLEVAALTEQVQVRGEANVVDGSATATKTNTPLQEVPAAVSVVPRALLQEQFALTLPDALRNVAGSQPQPGFGGLNGLPRIRGFQANSNLRDGFRQQTFFAQYDMATVERIEVLKGPASAVYGRFEPGGVVNLVSKRPLAAPQYAVELNTGSNDLYRLTVDAGGPLGSDALRYRANVALEDTNSYRDFVDTRKALVAPSIEWRPTASTSLLVEGQYLYRDGGFDRGFVVFAGNPTFARGLLDLPPNRNLGEPTDSARYRGTLTAVTLDHRLSPDWSLRAGAFVATSRLDDDFFTSGAPLMPDATTYNRRMLYADDEERDYTGQIELTGRGTTGVVRHQLLVGADATLERYDYTAFRVPTNSPINPFAPVYGQGAYGPPLVLAFGGRNRYLAVGGYAQDELAVGDVRVLVGGRIDTTDGTLVTTNPTPPDTEQSRTTAAFSPRLGLTYLWTPNVSTYASYARSFVTEIFGVLATGELTDPSRGTQIEAGVKADVLDNRLTTTLAVYQINKTNVVVGDSENPGFSIQTGEQRSRGVEIEAAARAGGGLTLSAAYAYNRATIVSDTNAALVGNRIVNTSPHTGSFWVAKQFGLPGDARVDVGGGLFGIGARPVNNGNLFFLPGYTRVDAVIAFTRGPWRIAVNGRNLTDERYFDSGGTVYYPGAPRQAFVSLGWRSR